VALTTASKSTLTISKVGGIYATEPIIANKCLAHNLNKALLLLLCLPLLEGSKLSTLVLSGGNVGDDGLIEMSKGITGNTHLTVIDLHRNSITDKGIAAFAEAIESASSLQLVILTANKISDDGVFALAKSARLNPSLQVIDCDMNTRISQAGRDALSAALEGKSLNVGRHQEL